MAHDKQRLLAAINDLILDPGPQHKLDAMDAILPVTRLYPAKLTGDMAVLNELVLVMREDPEGFAKIKGLIEAKRAEAGLDVCWKEPPHAKKERYNEYQKNLMAKRRGQFKRWLIVQNALRAPKDAIRGNPRLALENIKLKEWTKLKDSGAITEERLEEWLDELEVWVRGEMSKPVQARGKDQPPLVK